MSAPTLYPLFLKLHDRQCLVVGAGEIGAQKARELLEAGARVRVVSPEVRDEFWEPLFERFSARVELERRRFRPGDTDGAFIVVSATADAVVDAQIWAEGRANNCLVNVVDVNPKCDFYAGSVVRRGPVTVLIGTSGTSPSLSIAIRKRIEALLPEAVGEIAEALGRARGDLKCSIPRFHDRARLLNAELDSAFDQLDRFRSKAEISRWISGLFQLAQRDAKNRDALAERALDWDADSRREAAE